MVGMPPLRLAITDRCNLKCRYCPPFGENYSNVEKCLSSNELLKILKIAVEIGINNFKITGGEPLLEKERLSSVLEFLSKTNSIVSINTNGVELKNNVDFLLAKNVAYVKVSLDTLNPSKYIKICGADYLHKTIEGIKTAIAKGLKTRINMVVIKDNYNEVTAMIKFCQSVGADLKLLDLNYYEDVGKKYWLDNYQPLTELTKELSAKSSIRPVVFSKGGYGIPMTLLRLKNINVLIKDSKKGAMYGYGCKNCSFLPAKRKKFYCQEGIYNLTLTVDGKLKICKHRPDIGVSLRGLNKKRIKKAMIRIIADFFPGAPV